MGKKNKIKNNDLLPLILFLHHKYINLSSILNHFKFTTVGFELVLILSLMVVIMVSSIYEWDHNLNDAIALLKLRDTPQISNCICNEEQRYQLLKNQLRNRIMICAEFNQK